MQFRAVPPPQRDPTEEPAHRDDVAQGERHRAPAQRIGDQAAVGDGVERPSAEDRAAEARGEGDEQPGHGGRTWRIVIRQDREEAECENDEHGDDALGQEPHLAVLPQEKDERLAAAPILQGPEVAVKMDKDELVQKVHDALYASKIISYAQGLDLIQEVSKVHDWGVNLGSTAKIWRGGCIIRARFLNRITEAYERTPDLTNLMLDGFFTDILNANQSAWREVVALGVINGIPMPAFSASLSYYDSYRSEVLPANLLQAQRDFFGAHTYERVDKPAGEWFHTKWPELIED